MNKPATGLLNSLQQTLLNDWQTGLPLVSKPFETIAQMAGSTQTQVLQELKQFQENGTISRVGPVFRPNCIGASLLAAVAVPESKLESVAMQINQFDEVNHNYEREHRFNIWFVVTASNQQALDDALARIESEIGYQILCLPLLKDYHIDLSFNLDFDGKYKNARKRCGAGKLPSEQYLPSHLQDTLNAEQWQTLLTSYEPLIGQIQGGLPLVPQPYESIGERIAWSESQVVQALGNLCSQSVIKRLGVVVRHHELGYRANSMTVWDIPDERVHEVGKLLGDEPEVTLCYQRPRVEGRWPFNLFCMVHGKNHDTVRRQVEQLAAKHSLSHIHHELLFSKRRFKQRGAQYRAAIPGSMIHKDTASSDAATSEAGHGRA